MTTDLSVSSAAALRHAFSRRSFLKMSFLLTCLPARLLADEQPETVLRFAAMSDIHFSGKLDAPEVDRLRKALKFMYEYSAEQKQPGFDALLVAGDMSNHGKPEELNLFRQELDAGLRPETARVICMGNHEFVNGNKESWESIIGLKTNDIYNVNGFRFITLSPDRGNSENGEYASSMAWLKKTLDEAVAADPTKPIFLIQHYHISETVYGSCGDDTWGVNDLRELLNAYPQVIDFSGHSHYPINDPKSAWQGGYSAFGTGTLSYFEMSGGRYQKFPKDFFHAAQFYVVEVRKDNSVLLRPYDILTGEFFDLAYFVADPFKTESYIYTKKRIEKATAPTWHDGTLPTLQETGPDCVTLEFRHAMRPAPDDIVHSYRAAIEKKENGAWIEDSSRWLWSEYYFNKMPEMMTARLDSLTPDTEYRVRFFPIDAFEKEGQPLPAAEFKTAKAAPKTAE